MILDLFQKLCSFFGHPVLREERETGFCRCVLCRKVID